uniref:hypothetical protein n=1 Tax=Clostridium sp. NkU-1 TaxID=1095009 RepID=UPI0006D266DE
MEYPIDCAILLVYDVRETYTDIVFPELFSEYPNIDLSQIYRVDKKDISASSVYRHKKSAKRGIIFDG